VEFESNSLDEMAQVVLPTDNISVSLSVCRITSCTSEGNSPLMCMFRCSTELFFWRKHTRHIPVYDGTVDLDTLRGDEYQLTESGCKPLEDDSRVDGDCLEALWPLVVGGDFQVVFFVFAFDVAI
jgi:hypothetical protein